MRTASPTRRLKLVEGDGVFAAPQFAQEALERQFKLLFGKRYVGGFFGQNMWNGWWSSPYSHEKNFCIVLKD
jgi:hypothetical protein